MKEHLKVVLINTISMLLIYAVLFIQSYILIDAVTGFETPYQIVALFAARLALVIYSTALIGKNVWQLVLIG